MNVAEYLSQQEEWSSRTFGNGARTISITSHIRKELAEIEAEPHDLSEWVDVIILAMDGYWRHGGDPLHLMVDLVSKQQKNFARTWPAHAPDNEVVEHVRTGDIK